MNKRIENIIKNVISDLENSYKIKFCYNISGDDSVIKYFITPYDSNKELFSIDIEVRNSLRLSVVVEPELYGANFVKSIREASKEKKEAFCILWRETAIGNSRLTVKLDNNLSDINEFMNNNTFEKFSIRFTEAPYFDEEQNEVFQICKIINALCGMILCLADYSINGNVEGNKYIEENTKYERSSINRSICLLIHGYTCKACGFNFYEHYGTIGKKFIEVHHVVPVSQIGPNYIIDPVKDLVPLCSNCHSMIHRNNPPFSLEELKKIIEENKKSVNNGNLI